MEIKDWIIMLIPIAVNALLVFPLHKYIDWKVEDKLEKREKQRKIRNNFIDLVFQLYLKTCHIQRLVEQDFQIVSDQDFNNETRKLYRFYKINCNMLGEYSDSINIIYNNYCEALYVLSITEQGQAEKSIRLKLLVDNIVEELQKIYYQLTG